MRALTSTRRSDKQPTMILVVLFALSLVAGVLLRHDVVGRNVYAFGVALGGLSRGEAAQVVSDKAREVETGSLTFAAGDRSIVVSQADMKVLLDDERLVEDLDGAVSSRSRFIPSFVIRMGTRVVMAAPARVVSPDAGETVARIAADLSSEAFGTRYGLVGKELKVLPPQAGQAVTGDDVRRALERVSGDRIEVAFKQLPALAAKELPLLSLTGEFSTPYDIEDTDRNVNLSLATAAIHGKTLLCGETFSFNKEAGERTEEKGYRYANVVVGDHLEPGLAGGICQVTTTLFDAATLAGLDFPEVHAHGIPVGYVPPGMDAAVAWNYLDLKIRNGTSSTAVFGAWVEGGKVTVRVFGETNGKTYELVPVTVKTYPAPAPKEPGLLVETYRLEKSGGQEVGRALLLRSMYLPYVKVTTKD